MHVFVLAWIFISLGYILGGVDGSYINRLTFWKLPDCLPKSLHHLTSPSAPDEGCGFSTSSPTLVGI